MVDLTAIGVVSTSLNTLVNMTKAMKDVHDAKILDGKVFELQRAILETQQSVFAANEERAALIEEIREAKAKIARLEAWETEKQRYELKDVGEGSLAYLIKKVCAAPSRHIKYVQTATNRRKNPSSNQDTDHSRTFCFAPRAKQNFILAFSLGG